MAYGRLQSRRHGVAQLEGEFEYSDLTTSTGLHEAVTENLRTARLLHCKPQQIGLVKSNTLSSQCVDLSSACKNA